MAIVAVVDDAVGDSEDDERPRFVVLVVLGQLLLLLSVVVL